MNMKKMRMVTIVTESVLEERICSQALALGASGYTVCESRGHGSFGRNTGEIPGINIRIEIVAEESLADEILSSIAREYFSNFSMSCFLSDVYVVRGEKYVVKKR